MLVNTRDLGGMKTKDGRTVVHNKLIRGGMLIRASADDLKWLTQVPVTRVIDFRTPMECVDYPDPELPGVEFVNLAPMQDFHTGITREKNTDSTIVAIVRKTVHEDPEFTRNYFKRFYERLVDNEYAMGQYKRFVNYLAEDRAGATYWHCTAGKDRAGMAAMIIEEILGVDHDIVIEDYLKTNVYLEKDMLEWTEKMLQIGPADKVEQTIRDFFGAREEYLQASLDKIDSEYGGMDGFITDKLGVDAALKSKLMAKYLE